MPGELSITVTIEPPSEAAVRSSDVVVPLRCKCGKHPSWVGAGMTCWLLCACGRNTDLCYSRRKARRQWNKRHGQKRHNDQAH